MTVEPYERVGEMSVRQSGLQYNKIQYNAITIQYNIFYLCPKYIYVYISFELFYIGQPF